VISTNHIAKEAGISPGNLYYHFKNKEAIILALFETMVIEWDQTKQSPESQSIPDIEQQLSKVFQTVWRYQFAHRELSPLIQTYPSLKAYCSPILRSRIEEIQQIIDVLIRQEILKAIDESTRDFLANSLLMIPLFWQAYLDVINENSSKINIEKGVNMMKLLIQPYLS